MIEVYVSKESMKASPFLKTDNAKICFIETNIGKIFFKLLERTSRLIGLVYAISDRIENGTLRFYPNFHPSIGSEFLDDALVQIARRKLWDSSIRLETKVDKVLPLYSLALSAISSRLTKPLPTGIVPKTVEKEIDQFSSCRRLEIHTATIGIAKPSKSKFATLNDAYDQRTDFRYRRF